MYDSNLDLNNRHQVDVEQFVVTITIQLSRSFSNFCTVSKSQSLVILRVEEGECVLMMVVMVSRHLMMG